MSKRPQLEYLHVRLDWAGFDERIKYYGRDGFGLVGFSESHNDKIDFVFERTVLNQDEQH